MIGAILRKVRLVDLIYILTGGLLLGLGAVIAPVNHYIEAVLLIVGAVVLYFYIVLCVAEKNWLDVRAAFTGVWLFTIGLASLRLMDYQEQWQSMTWVCNAIAYVMFQLGGIYGTVFGERISEWAHAKKRDFGRIHFELKEKRLYWICIGITLMGIVSFLINIYIKGYVPFFSANPAAYVEFYTKFHIFAVASTMISGLCYYCIRTQDCSVVKKIILWICIIYATLLFPTLVVSRGTFITSALSLATAIFYLHGKKLRVLISSIVIIMGTYLILSSARGYSDAQLNAFFEPSEIEVTQPTEDPDEPVNNITFQLPGKVAFLYSYLTVSHDNFNEAVENSTEYTYGVRQLAPFNTVLRSEKINEIIGEGEYYLVRPHLNTVSLIGGFYYDLHEFGVAIFMFLWGVVFNTIQAYYLKGKGQFALWALGNTMTPVVMCFFSAWMQVFSHWMHWGLCFLAFLVACINILPSKNGKEI